jgi:hypothetical protein
LVEVEEKTREEKTRSDNADEGDGSGSEDEETETTAKEAGDLVEPEDGDADDHAGEKDSGTEHRTRLDKL